MRREEIAGGEAPIVEGDEGDRFYVVLNGIFAVSNFGTMPRRMLRPGDYFGEVALAMSVPRTASVRALTPAVVASCDKQTFDEFLRPLFADDGPGRDAYELDEVREELAHGRRELEAVPAARRARRRSARAARTRTARPPCSCRCRSRRSSGVGSTFGQPARDPLADRLDDPLVRLEILLVVRIGVAARLVPARLHPHARRGQGEELRRRARR